ncbi:hypothetical protein Vadar_034014 [Vaccinium darrowii]|uniref:Uncharacterized protein n=1 Tax=Vaccinium darrowii TaxID=229202 RepID=A0ACB7ZH86_9ERIC|nr:hypothetical protein Vadar_034014 [Vaccinium darrowii]
MHKKKWYCNGYRTNPKSSRKMWGWHREYRAQKEANIEIPPSLLDGVSQNEEDLSYMFDETTPIKACGDLAYHVADGVNMNKELQHCREPSSQGKRRRMLQFDNEVSGSPFCNEEISSVFLKSKEREDSLEQCQGQAFDMSEWVNGFAVDTPGSSCEELDQSSEGWLADCFNDIEMHCSPDDVNQSGVSDITIDTSEFCNTPPEYEAAVVPQERPSRTRRNVVFKGKKSYMRTPTKLASSVAYPFAFIKPCGAHGDVTLKDINQRIRTPPPLKPKHRNEDPSASYPTSAFSGKPVVGKTKIHTEGGKGSITIMRTKG